MLGSVNKQTKKKTASGLGIWGLVSDLTSVKTVLLGTESVLWLKIPKKAAKDL